MSEHKHNWECIEVSMDASAYECKKCGINHVVHPYRMETFLPSTGCSVPDRRPQYVVCAAIRIDNFILCGARHWDVIMRSQAEAIGLDKIRALKKELGEEQGFIDQYGKFLTRKEAMEIVKKNGQPFDIDRNRGDVTLFSEGLY